MSDRKNAGLLEKLIADFSVEPEELLETVGADKEQKIKGSIPLRVQILAEGFAKGWNAGQVNEELLRRECEPLYARSYYEAGLIYAFDHGLNYGQWRALSEECEVQLSDQNRYFQGGKITLKELKAYVYSESGQNLQTLFLTHWMEQGIKEQETQEDYRKFVQANLEKFSSVRERARYYFCKYLYFYIQDRCTQYYKSCEKEERYRQEFGSLLTGRERENPEDFALEELSFLKPLTKLKKDAQKQKNRMSLEEKKEYLENAALTPGGVFDEFNYFYFGYVSVEWVEILFELYGEFKSWPLNTRVRVAHSLGLCPQKPSRQELQAALDKLAEMEERQREKEALLDAPDGRCAEVKKKAYQRGRSGEDFFRDFITGKRDINRTTLISFLLFVKARVALDEQNKITLNRMNHILQGSGFAQLRPDNGFDKFVMGFLRASDPMELLEEEVENQVVQGKNFYLYKVYKDSYCHQKELLDYLF